MMRSICATWGCGPLNRTISSSMIARAVDALMLLEGLSPSARRVGTRLVSRTDKSRGFARVSQVVLADELSLHRLTVCRAVGELRARGLLHVQSRGRGRVPLYRLNWKMLGLALSAISDRVKASTSAWLAKRAAVAKSMIRLPHFHWQLSPGEPNSQGLGRAGNWEVVLSSIAARGAADRPALSRLEALRRLAGFPSRVGPFETG